MECLRSYIRASLIEEHRERLLSENVIKRALRWAKTQGTKGRIALSNFLLGLKEELSETKMGLGLLQKIAAGQKLSSEETAFLKEQSKDLIAGTFLLGLFALPGGAIATAGLVSVANRYGIDLMPSSFASKDIED
tara:strand:+ start:928 stop:1332 length:405 start_codon:yes stop_codon:yes gene_type:complete